MSRFPGNIIKLPNVTPTQSSASGVWSLKDQMVYQRNNLWPFQRDPYFNYTTLLLQGNVPNTTGPQAMNLPLSYNADASTNNFLVTPNGDVGPRPFSPYFGGNYSVYFNGTSLIQAPDNASMQFGATDFTIEFWAYFPNGFSGSQWIGGKGDQNTIAGSAFSLYASAFDIYAGSSTYTLSCPTWLAGRWYHVAIVRSGSGSNNLKLWIDGNLHSQVSIGSNSVNSASGNGFKVGAYSSGGPVSYISNFRIVKGRAVYTSAFSPSLVALGATSGGQNPPQGTETSLLICQSNRFIDNSVANSGTGWSLTVSSSPSITDNSPFVSTDFTTGAGYFNGTTDYLSAGNQAALHLGSGNFTVEMWLWKNANTSYMVPCGDFVNGGENTFQIIGDATGTKIAWYNGVSLSFVLTSNSAVPINTWNHIAFVRNSGTLSLYLNGSSDATPVALGTDYNATTSFVIGNTAQLSPGRWWSGYISNLRVVKGVAVYTGNFSPPSLANLGRSGATSIAAYPSTNNVNISFAESATSLLTLQTRAPSQNINFIDSSPNEFIVTKNGNTTQGTFSPFSPTGWATRFDGSANYRLNVPDSTDLDLTGDFSLELWVYFTANSSSNQLVCLGSESASQNGFIFYNPGSTTTLSLYTNGGAPLTTSSGSIALNTWHHLALVRSGTGAGNTVVYVDGVSKGSAQITTSFTGLAANGLCIGQTYNGSFVGVSNTYISNVRLTKGQALYTGAFTPPTAALTTTSVGTSGTNVATSITGQVVLLTCQSNRFLDQTGKTITVTGSPSVQAFSPFAPANAVSPLVTGGSGYFDGSDSLQVPSNPLFNYSSTDMTVELWLYLLTIPAEGAILELGTGATTGDIQLIVVSSAGGISFGTSGRAKTWIAVAANQWYHIAGVKSGSTYYLYVNGTRYTTESGNSTSSSTTVNIGSRNSTTNYLTGYMSNYKISNYARYNTTTIPVPTTPAVSDANTSLLLNFTNGAAVDATGKNNLESVGKAQNSGVQAKFNYLTGGSSLQFDGSSGWLLAPTSANWDLGTGDFTVECWIRFVSIPTSPSFSAIVGKWGNGTYAWILQANSSVIRFYTGNSGSLSSFYDFSWTPSANTWYHLAVTRASSNLRAFVDGSQIGTTQPSVTQNLTSATAICAVGENRDGASGQAQYINGYLSNLRITKYARYTANFNTNLPTGPFPIG